MQENREEDEWERIRAKLEVPPVGYEGSLEGTVWDPDIIIQGYEQAGGDISR